MPETSLPHDSDIANIAELEAWIRHDPRGFVMDHDTLYWFDRQVKPIIWGEFIAAENPATLPRPDDSDQWVGEHALAGLFAFDGSYWLIGGPGPVIERVIDRFEHVEHLDPRQWVREAR